MTKFELGRHIARSVLIKLASTDSGTGSAPANTTAKSNKNNENKPRFIDKAMPYIWDVAPALPLAGYLALADRQDPARLVGGLTGALGGYLTNKVLIDNLMNAIEPKEKSKDNLDARNFVGRTLGGLNIGLMSGLGRLAGGAIAGKQPLGASDVWHTLLMPAAGLATSSVAGTIDALKS